MVAVTESQSAVTATCAVADHGLRAMARRPLTRLGTQAAATAPIRRLGRIVSSARRRGCGSLPTGPGQLRSPPPSPGCAPSPPADQRQPATTRQSKGRGTPPDAIARKPGTPRRTAASRSLNQPHQDHEGLRPVRH